MGVQAGNIEDEPEHCASLSTYGYGDEYCTSSRKGGFGMWCEFGLKCANLGFSEMNTKAQSNMFIPTILKEITTHYGACSDDFEEECASMGGKNRSTAVYKNSTAVYKNNDKKAEDLESNYLYIDGGT